MLARHDQVRGFLHHNLFKLFKGFGLYMKANDVAFRVVYFRFIIPLRVYSETSPRHGTSFARWPHFAVLSAFS
jgi:hypothetical protein